MKETMGNIGGFFTVEKEKEKKSVYLSFNDVFKTFKELMSLKGDQSVRRE